MFFFLLLLLFFFERQRFFNQVYTRYDHTMHNKTRISHKGQRIIIIIVIIIIIIIFLFFIFIFFSSVHFSISKDHRVMCTLVSNNNS